MQELFISLYSLINRSGLMQHSAMRRIFRLAYFNYKRHLEDPFLNLTHRHPELFCSGNILDVGANIGYTAWVFSKCIKSPYKVYAFEPDKANFQMLEDTIKAYNLLDFIIPIRSAVGNRDGETDFLCDNRHHGNHQVFVPGNNIKPSSSSNVSKVGIISLDSFVKAHIHIDEISLIKIDVQGYELMVCRGMENILSNNQKLSVALEYAPKELKTFKIEPVDILDFFEARGFIPYLIHHNGSLKQEKFQSLHKIAANSEGYVNILFCRQEIIS